MLTGGVYQVLQLLSLTSLSVFLFVKTNTGFLPVLAAVLFLFSLLFLLLHSYSEYTPAASVKYLCFGGFRLLLDGVVFAAFWAYRLPDLVWRNIAADLLDAVTGHDPSAVFTWIDRSRIPFILVNDAVNTKFWFVCVLWTAVSLLPNILFFMISLIKVIRRFSPKKLFYTNLTVQPINNYDSTAQTEPSASAPAQTAALNLADDEPTNAL